MVKIPHINRTKRIVKINKEITIKIELGNQGREEERALTRYNDTRGHTKKKDSFLLARSPPTKSLRMK